MQTLRYDGPKAIENRSLETAAVLDLVATIGYAIREAGQIPSGHLYAMLCGKMDLRQYNSLINLLKRTKMVREDSYLLTWIGPKPE